MTAQRYVHEILQPHVLQLMQWLSGALFLQDNAWPHTARVSQDCLHTVTTLPWPARSLDLSPIERIWDHLGWRVGHPMSLNELELRDENVTVCGLSERSESPRSPSGYDHEHEDGLSSRVSSKYSALKTHHVKRLVHIKSVEAQSPPLEGCGNLKKECQNSGNVT
ncbi:transposable element Tcb1 transposase [Trichonephila clavipes]|nr:transposable element Tcb1 transposase [Trichonephila clavipes]